MSQELTFFLRSIAREVDNEDGKRVAALLSFKQMSEAEKQRILTGCESSLKFEQAAQNALKNHWRDIVACSLRSSHAMSKGVDAEAFQFTAQAIDVIREYIEGTSNTNWFLPVVDFLLGQFRITGLRSDKANKTDTGSVKIQQVITKIFPLFLRDSTVNSRDSKKHGLLFVINHLLKMAFQIRNLRMCSTYVRNILTLAINDPNWVVSSFPKSQSVCFEYYSGRMFVFEEKFVEAEKSLDFAFQHCHAGAVHNKRRILEFLIPVKLRLGSFPSLKLLRKYNLMQFADLSKAVQSGDQTAYSHALSENQAYFVQKGIFLLLDQLKMFVYRNVFCKTYAVYKALEPDSKKAAKVPMEYFLEALRLQGESIDMDELECILANLISQGFIKGYASHKYGVLVVHPQLPFPKLSDVTRGVKK